MGEWGSGGVGEWGSGAAQKASCVEDPRCLFSADRSNHLCQLLNTGAFTFHWNAFGAGVAAVLLGGSCVVLVTCTLQ